MRKDLPTMIEVEDKVVSMDLITCRFACDLSRCKGACCVEGESGAPLEAAEVRILNREYASIRPFLREEGNEAIGQLGPWVVDADRETVTPLVQGRECAYAVFEDGIARCGIEKAYESGATSFRKPVSCHIYPMRVKSFRGITGMNYDRWMICDPARELGEKEDVPVFRFLREAIERKYGKEFYGKLEMISRKVGQKPDRSVEL
jgi:hypothetical protein